MQENFNAQKDTMERDVTMNIIAQLQRLNPGLTLNSTMLRFNVRSPGDKPVLQLSNHLYVHNNTRGQYYYYYCSSSSFANIFFTICSRFFPYSTLSQETE